MPGLALADARLFGRVKAVEFVLVMLLLLKQASHQTEFSGRLLVLPHARALGMTVHITPNTRPTTMRTRQRDSDEASTGGSCRRSSSPQKYCQSGFSTQFSVSISSEQLNVCCS
jgi:hypothetical protein